jgi:peptide deformylase
MLVESTNKVLHTKTQLVTQEQFDTYKNTLQPIASLLVKTIYEQNALGVSACQLGIDLAMFAMLVNDKIRICVNPEIVGASFNMIIMEEGCLSFPGLLLKVKRPEGVIARYFSLEGTETTERLEGLEARVWMHEFDHCQGICFTDRVGKLSLSMAKKKLDKKRKQNKNAK